MTPVEVSIRMTQDRDKWRKYVHSTSKHQVKLKLKLKTILYSAIKSGDSEAFDGVTSQRGSQRRCGEIKMF